MSDFEVDLGTQPPSPGDQAPGSTAASGAPRAPNRLALFQATLAGDSARVKRLLAEYGAKAFVWTGPPGKNDYNFTLLHAAVVGGCSADALAALAAGRKDLVNAAVHTDGHGDSWVRDYMYEFFELVGSDAESAQNSGYCHGATPLGLAIQSFDSASVEALLELGAGPHRLHAGEIHDLLANCFDYGKNLAARKAIVEALLQHSRFDCLARVGYHQQSALAACHPRHGELVATMLKHLEQQRAADKLWLGSAERAGELLRAATRPDQQPHQAGFLRCAPHWEPLLRHALAELAKLPGEHVLRIAQVVADSRTALDSKALKPF